MLPVQKFLIESGAKTIDELKEILAPKKIVISDYDKDFIVLSYFISASFKDPVVKNSRGIILHRNSTFDVACHAFDKFCNYGESGAAKIQWSTARVQDKLDGSIIKLWYNTIDDCWAWSSSSLIKASDSFADAAHTRSLMDIIKETPEYAIIIEKIENNNLDKNCTYIFELCSQYNTIVIKYTTPKLWHIGTRNIKSEEEMYYNIDDKIDQPKEYDIHSIEEAKETVARLSNHARDVKEGFVIVDGNYNRVKLKTPEYLALHYMRDSSQKPNHALELVLHGDLEEFMAYYPEYNHIMLYYKFHIEELIYQIELCVKYTEILLSRGYSRDDIAREVKDNKFKHFIFKFIDTRKSAREMVMDLSANKLLKSHIKPYNRKDYR